MIVFHGTHIKDWKPEAHISSRYGFSAIFCTDDPHLAKLYAEYYARHVPSLGNKGYLYRFEIPDIGMEFDFERQITYASNFRNLMYKVNDSCHTIAKIKNCYDWPCEALRDLVMNDIYVVFDFKLIRNIELLEVLG